MSSLRKARGDGAGWPSGGVILSWEHRQVKGRMQEGRAQVPEISKALPGVGSSQGVLVVAWEMVGDPRGKAVGHCQAAWGPLTSRGCEFRVWITGLQPLHDV